MARDAVLIGKQDGKWLMLIAPDAPGGEAVQAYKQARGNDGVIGKDQFETVIKPVYQQGRKGYFSVAAYLGNELIQTLLAEITAQKSVASAA
jgi:hypothetical protein